MLFDRSVLLLFYLSFIAWALGSQYPGNENGTCYRRVPYTEELSENISRGIVKAPAELQPIPIKKSDARAWMTIVECCEGYYLNASTETCLPRCEGGCSGGSCIAPNVCDCFPGHVLEEGSCKPYCHRACAVNAYCIAPEVCACQYGYEEQGGVCRPVCRHNCLNGQCVAPRDCRCNPGYFLNETQHCEPVCESGCPHGQCISPGVCACNYGYKRPPNNPETCVASCPESCANGECHSPGVCTCKQGYGRVFTDECIPLCEGGCANGRCIAPEQCECDVGFLLHPHTKKCVEPSEAYKAGPIYEGSYAHGTAYGNRTQEVRRPEDRYTSYDESQRYRDHGPLSVLGLNETTRSHSTAYPYDSRSENQSHEHPQERPDSTESSLEQVTESHRDPYEIERTRRPQGPFADNRDYRTQRPNTSPGPYSTHRIATVQTHEEEIHDTDRSVGIVVTAPVQESTRNTYTDRPYRTREYEESLRRRGQIASQRPDPSQDDRDADYYRRNYGSSTQEVVKNPPYRRPTVSVQTNTESSQGTDRPYGIVVTAPALESTRDTYTDRPYRTREYEESLRRRAQIASRTPDPSQEDRETDDYRRNYGSSTQEIVRNPPYRRPSVTVETNAEVSEDTDRPYGIVVTAPAQESTRNPYTERPYRTREYEESLRRRGQIASQRANPSQEDRETDDYRRNNVSSTHQSVNRPPYRRPVEDQRRRRPEENPNVTRPTRPTYDPNERRHDPRYDRPLIGEVPSQPYRPNDPYNPPNRPGSVEINRTYNREVILTHEIHHSFGNNEYAIEDVGTPDPNQYSPLCSTPCLNGDCIGPNQCSCKPGYQPDPRSPYGSLCKPVCRGGCQNGVCSGPNLCLCNPGFTKENGIKGSQRCVPTN